MWKEPQQPKGLWLLFEFMTHNPEDALQAGPIFSTKKRYFVAFVRDYKSQAEDSILTADT